MADTPLTQHWTRSIDSALLVLLLTAACYGVAFAYQAGYLSHFGVPTELAEVSVRDLFLCAGALSSIAIGLFAFVQIALRLLPKKWSSTVRHRVGFHVVWLGVMLVLLPRWAPRPVTALIGFGFPAVMLVGELLMPLLTHRDIPGYSAKLEASIRQDVAREAKTIDGNFFTALFALLSRPIALFVLAAFLIAIFSYAAGRDEARRRDVYPVPREQPDCVIVRSLSLGLLCVGFDEKTRQAVAEYRFLRPEDIRLTLKHTGPLKEAETPTEEPKPTPESHTQWIFDNPKP